tara:strand:+ start:2104 stop:2355 length:252 start_codon:yes stop_codon:yes gene_type:complete
MTDIVIPAEVREAVAKAIYEHWRSVTLQGPLWEEVNEDWRNGTLGQAEAGITALFMSWPGMRISWLDSNDGAIVLPLTEKTDG